MDEGNGGAQMALQPTVGCLHREWGRELLLLVYRCPPGVVGNQMVRQDGRCVLFLCCRQALVSAAHHNTCRHQLPACLVDKMRC